MLPADAQLIQNLMPSCVMCTSPLTTFVLCRGVDFHPDLGSGPVIYLGGLQPFFPVIKGVEKILVTMF